MHANARGVEFETVSLGRELEFLDWSRVWMKRAGFQRTRMNFFTAGCSRWLEGGTRNESNRRYRKSSPTLLIIEGTAAPRSIDTSGPKRPSWRGVSPMIYVRPNASVIYPFLGLDSLLEDLRSGGGGGERSLQDFPRILSRVKANAIPCHRRGEKRRGERRERFYLACVSRSRELWGLSFSSRKDTRWNYIRSPRDIGRRRGGGREEGGRTPRRQTDRT